MIINYLELDNFRQFTGKQRINFSVDSVKKTTLIFAESGVGKTTMIQCFRWIFYGECKYKNPLNAAIKNSLAPSQTTKVSCSTSVSHLDKILIITRSQCFFKAQTQLRNEGDSELIIDIKGEDGITEQKRGREADKILKDLMPQDLFPYFFIEGENLTRVGEQVSRGKSGNDSEFGKAIKGLLGFNYLYETKKHLTKTKAYYQDQIARNTTDKRIREIIELIKREEQNIAVATDRINNIESQLEYYTKERNKLSEDIQKYGALENQQKRTKQLETELLVLDAKINEQKKCLFKKFSAQGIFLLMNSMIQKAEEALENSAAMDKGIPGIEVSAVEYLLKSHKCICGKELKEGSDEWEKLSDLIKYLPPNNIGYEIKNFQSEMRNVKSNARIFVEDYEKYRKDLDSFVREYNLKTDELTRLNEEIGSYSQDVSLLKNQENEYNTKITELNFEKKKKNEEIEEAKGKKQILADEQSGYKIIEEKVRKLQAYCTESEYLSKKIENYCKRKEEEKRKQLEDAINEIFKDFYEEKIRFEVDSNYAVQIKTFFSEASEDFTSGGQDVAVALAFIGAIIKLNKEQISLDKSDDENISEDDNKELYPLIMDAPTSNFGMKQMSSFSKIMPKITDQIIVFINDKDGPILKKQMVDSIGREWKIAKIDTYHSTLEEVIING